MAEHRLKPMTAFGLAAPRQETLDGLTLTEVPFLSIASVALRAGDDGSTAATLTDLIGAPLPGPGRAAGTDGVRAIWTAPDQWFVLSEDETLPDRLRLTLPASVTEQSDGWCCFEIAGPATPALLERLSLLDTAAADPGFAARSIVHHIGCFVICDAPADHWRLLCPRSSAPSLFETVLGIARGLPQSD